MRFMSLASSSKANCYVVEHHGAALLVDAGMSKRGMIGRLCEAGIDPGAIQALLISHHHGDHAKYAGDVSAALHIPLYCSEDTLDSAPQSLLAKAEKVQTFVPGGEIHLDAFDIEAVTTYHTPGAVGFMISAAGRHLSIFTDVAELSGGVADVFERSHVVAVEADYSEPMLAACDYDPELRRRIRLTHTSNEKLAAFFTNGFKGAALHTVVLLHISHATNVSFIAEQKVSAALRQWCMFKKPPGCGFKVEVAKHDGVTGPVEV